MNESNSVIGTRAPVAPRAHRPGGEARPTLEQLVRPFIEKRARGAIYIVCPAGFGKTTALSHLRAVLPADPDVRFFDEPSTIYWRASDLALVATTKVLPHPALAIFELAQWSDDDCLEYLASRHREKCAGVMKQLASDELREALDGSPAHLRIVMDEMAGDESITVAEALRRYVSRSLSASVDREAIGMHAAASLGNDKGCMSIVVLQKYGLDDSASRFCSQRAVALALGSQWAADSLRSGTAPHILQFRLGRAGIRAIGSAVKPYPRAVAQLNNVLNTASGWGQSMAASILLASDPDWRPSSAKGWKLPDAILTKARWAKLVMKKADLSRALLGQADLSDADLTKVLALGASMSWANFQGATLEQARFDSTNLCGANLANAKASDARFDGAELIRASFSSACLRRALFQSANLTGADFRNADLSEVDLSRANLVDTIFDNARLDKAEIKETDLREASWWNASFAGAKIVKCRLDGLELPNANFEEAVLVGSDMTGTRIRSGRFRGVNLSAAGLADIEWEHADLRDADFQYASFHLGSSRSGLVGSPIACEGSRTGFYTDEFTEQDYKTPEEIRKANLCGADLRGAKVFDCDFYLVDLRDAQYTPEQAEHFTKCGAILFSRSG